MPVQFSLQFSAIGGTSFFSVLLDAQRISRLLNVCVKYNFNGEWIYVYPDSNLQSIADNYCQKAGITNEWA